VFLVLLGLWWSPEDSDMGDLVRIMYVHVPSAWLAYMAFIITAIGSAMFLWKRSVWWDLVAGASAEIGWCSVRSRSRRCSLCGPTDMGYLLL
jgi:heme exporter protein C